MTSIVHSISKKVTSSVESGQAIASIRLDWAIALLSGWWVGGAYIDGWAHRHDRVDQSFFTPWHAVFYSGFLAVACVLLITVFRNSRRGYGGWQAVPAGYEWSMLGVATFAFGGVADFVWHALFGIEASTEALLSPTHLLLAFGAILIMHGPLRARDHRLAPNHGFVQQLPVLLSLAFVLSMLSFMTQFAHPLIDPWAAKQPGNAQSISQLYVMNADGTGQTRLLNDPQIQYWYPTYSRDGRKIAYAAGTPQKLQIFVANADGSSATQLTNDQATNINPDWSPDGRQIVFSSAREGKFQLYVMNADGSKQTRLTDSGSNLYAAWSPSGRQIAFTGIRAEEWQVYVMNADGSGETRLTNTEKGNYFPQWSPDGRKIVFTSGRDGQNQIFVMNADGSDQTRLTDNTADERFGRWSPSGDKIVFASRRNGYFDIYAMNGDGTRQTNLTNNPGMENGGLQSWSPDGRKIIYTAESRPRLQPFLTENLGIASILLQAALLVGLVLLALRRWPLPPGTLTLIFTLNSILMSFLNDQFQFIPAAFAAGLLCDGLLWWLKPSANRPGALRLFVFLVPAIYYSSYFLVVMLTQGIAWSIHLWIGSIVLAGVVGVLLSYLMPSRAPMEQRAE